jgi:hypothetical protein
MAKLIIFGLVCLLSPGCAAFLAGWSPHSTIRDIYIVDSLDDPFLIVLYAPFAFAAYAIVDWWRASTEKAK